MIYIVLQGNKQYNLPYNFLISITCVYYVLSYEVFYPAVNLITFKKHTCYIENLLLFEVSVIP